MRTCEQCKKPNPDQFYPQSDGTVLCVPCDNDRREVADINNLLDQLAELRAHLESAAVRRAALKSQIALLNGAITRMAEQNGQLESDLAEAHREIDRLRIWLNPAQ